MKIPRLNLDTQIFVEYSDNTVFGGPLTSKLKDSSLKLFSPIYETAEKSGPAYVVEHSLELLEELRKDVHYHAILDKTDPTKISSEVLYPDTSLIKPSALNIISTNESQSVRIEFHPELFPLLHDLIAALYGADMQLGSSSPDVIQLYKNVLTELESQNMLLSNESNTLSYEIQNRSTFSDCNATFIGHNAVTVRSGSTQVVIDPWFFPVSKAYQNDYQPIIRSEIGKVDALLITHSHPDHFDPGTLLQFDKRTEVIVPRVKKESILAIDMQLRLQELGFENVHTLDWWEEKWVGDICVAALPFYGEQPTSSDQLHPEIRNIGNTYLVRTPRLSCGFIADSGRDSRGDVRDVALRAYRRWGSIDVLFSGYRGWYLYPIQYVGSSVPWYLLFVPPDLYNVRQSIMNGISEAVDTAEIWHAHYLVPYGDGGAPWYSDIGLGPAFDTNSYYKKQKEWLYFDPLPERCIKELKVRSSPVPGLAVGSSVLPLLLRPGQSIRLVNGQAEIIDTIYHRPRQMVVEEEVLQ